MLSRIAKLILFLLVLGAVLYIVLLNRDQVTVHLGGDTTYQAMVGIVLIVVFALGLLAASLAGAFFGVRTYFRERQLLSRERQRQALYQGLLQARSYAAGNEWSKARNEFEHLVSKHATDLISRVELSRVVEDQGDPREALRILDAARVQYPENVEVLLRAAELNISLNNRTAAIDNLALVLVHQPNARAARMARDLSEELERYDDALEYQERLEALGDSSEDAEEARGRIRFKKLLKDFTDNPTGLKEAVAAFVKRDPTASAVEKLAELEIESGNLEQAALLYGKAARKGGSPSLVRKAAELWISLNQPQQAVAAARAATKEATAALRIFAELELIKVYIGVNMLDEARAALGKLPALAVEYNTEIPVAVSQEALLLESYISLKMGNAPHAASVIKAIIDGSLQVNRAKSEASNGQVPVAPAPRLSTP